MAAPAAAEATCSINGTVTDLTGRPIDDATVAVVEPVQVVAADRKGQYCVKGLPAGDYEILVRAPGFRQQTLTVQVHLLKDAGAVDFTLEPSLQERVVTTATRTDKALADVPIRVEVMTRDDIEKVDARTLADAVDYTSGVYVESNCQNCNFSQVRLLGLDGAYSQILVDSQPVMSSLAAVYGIEHIPANMIQQLEIVKGGGSALYGSGAVGGVINVIPRTPVVNGGSIEMELQRTDYDTYGDSEGRPESMQGSFDLVSNGGRTAFTAFGQSDRIEAVDVSGDGFSEVSSRDLDAVGFRLIQKVGAADNAALSLDFSRVTEDRRGGNKLDLRPDQADLAESIDSVRTSASATWRQETSESFSYSLTAAVASTERDSYYGSGMDPNAYGRTENPLLVLDSQFNHVAGDHTITWGAQYSRDDLEDEQPAYARFTDETYTNAGLYIQDDWAVGSAWSLLWGARVDDHSEVDNAIVSPRVAVKFSPADTVNLRGSIASGFRAPQVFDEDLHITQVGGEGQVIRNAENLTEESSLSSMLGVEWLPKVGLQFARLEANLFHTKIDDLFLVVEDDDPLTPDQFEFLRVNFGSAEVYGLEVNGDLSISRQVTLSAGFVTQRSLLGEADPDFGTRQFFRTPDQYGLLGIDFDIPKVAEVFVAAKYTGEMKAPHYISDPITGDEIDSVLEDTPDFLTWDVRISRDIPLGKRGAMELTLGVRNLTDEYQSDLDDGEFRDSGYVYGPRYPRMLYAAVGYEF